MEEKGREGTRYPCVLDPRWGVVRAGTVWRMNVNADGGRDAESTEKTDPSGPWLSGG